MIRIGSRGSKLALWQANYVAGALRAKGHQVRIEIIRTTGDRLQVPFGAVDVKGMFTKEIDDALLTGGIDLAVHSLKDLPTAGDQPFTFAAIPERADARDVLVSERYRSLDALPPGAVVGTSSLRRRAQLSALRPDLQFIEFRGNVDTRLKKLQEGQADAIILAAAGLDRLRQTDWIRQRFSPQVLCPAAGQGAMAIECRIADDATYSALQPLDDLDTREAVVGERKCLAALGGGCQVPIGVYCHRVDDEFSMRAVVASPDGSKIFRGQMTHSDPATLGERLAARLIQQGARTILGREENPR